MLVYNAFAFLGCAAGIVFLLTRGERRLPLLHVFLLPCSLMVFGRFSARFFHLLERGDGISDWSYYFSFGPGPTSQFAGLYPSLLWVGIYALAFRVRPLRLLDALVPAVALAIVFGRLGCLFAGCCAGVLLPFRWTTWSAIPNPDNLPAPLIEAAAALALFLFLSRTSRRLPPVGCVTGYFLLIHGACRFLFQWVRASSLPWGPLTSTQVLAIPLMLAGALLLDWRLSRRHAGAPLDERPPALNESVPV